MRATDAYPPDAAPRVRPGGYPAGHPARAADRDGHPYRTPRHPATDPDGGADPAPRQQPRRPAHQARADTRWLAPLPHERAAPDLRADAEAEPVFVDHSGRRRRILVLAGAAGGTGLLLALVALLLGLTGVGPGAVPGWPGAGDGPKPSAAQIPQPAASPAQPGAPGSVPTSAPATRSAPPTGPGTSAAPTTSTGASAHRKNPSKDPTTHPGKP